MLVIQISLDGEEVLSTIGVRRLYPRGKPNDYDECVYSVGRIFHGKIHNEIGRITHKYGDGAEVLASLALSVVANHELSSIEEEINHRLIKLMNSCEE